MSKKNPFVRNKIDCSQIKDNNPTLNIQEHYSKLMAIEDLETLKNKSSEIIQRSSISRKNLTKFYYSRDNINTLDEYRLYITNFMLAGSGMSTRFDD